MKYLDQLRVLAKDDLIQLARQSDLGEGFLLGLRSQAVLQNVKARIGMEVWKKLGEEGISSVWDLAPLTPTRIQELSQKYDIDPTVLTTYSHEAKNLPNTP